MKHIGDTKVTKVVSTKITDEEHQCLMRLAKHCHSLGYIAKPSISEFTRFALRELMDNEIIINKTTPQATPREAGKPIIATAERSQLVR